MPARRRVGKEVAGARRDVDAILVDGNAEGVPRRRHAWEEGGVTNGWFVAGLVGEGRNDTWAEPDRSQESNRTYRRPPRRHPTVIRSSMEHFPQPADPHIHHLSS